MIYQTNSFMDWLFQEMQPKENLINCEEDQMKELQKERIEQLKDVLKLQKLEENFHQNIRYELEDNFESMGIQIDKYRVSAIKHLDFPVYHIKPEQSNGKVILYLHGHDDLGIMGALLERYDKVRYHKMIPLKLAKAGYEVYAPEECGLGDARMYDFPRGSEKLSGCVPNADYLTLAGFSLGGFRVYQSIRTLDFMELLGVHDNITVFGISGGGMTTQQILPIDQRLSAGIVACYSNSYETSILAKDHCICNYIPNLLSVGDSYQLLSLAVPKRLLTVNGIFDRGFPQSGSEKAFAYLQQVYDRFGKSDCYEGKLIEGKHEVDEEVILDWLKRNVLS